MSTRRLEPHLARARQRPWLGVLALAVLVLQSRARGLKFNLDVIL